MYYTQAIEDYARIEQTILFIEKNFARQPSLKEIASHIGLSEHHFQRLFSRWAGISPKRFLQYLTLEHAKKLLAESKSVLDATYESGLSSPGRLHDLFVACEAVTPGEYKKQASGITITYGFHASPFGECLLAMTERGVCNLEFVPEGQREVVLSEGQVVTTREDGVENRVIFSPAERIFNEGVEALKGGDMAGAKGKFLEAVGKNEEMAAVA